MMKVETRPGKVVYVVVDDAGNVIQGRVFATIDRAERFAHRLNEKERRASRGGMSNVRAD
jgi:hypothetical protein